MTVTAKPNASPKGARSLLAILSFLRAYPGAVALSIGLLLVNIAIEMVSPQILGDAITQLGWHMEWGAAFDPMVFVWLFGSLVLVRSGNGWLLGPVRNRLVQRTLGDIRAAIFDAVQRQSFAFHDRSNTGELVSRSTTDVSRLQDFLFATLFLSVDILVALVVITVLIFQASLTLGWVALGTLAPTVGLMAVFAARLQPKWREVHDLHSAMTTVVQENVAGVRVVRAFAGEPREVGKFQIHRDRFLKTLLDTVNAWAIRVPMAQFIFGLSVPLALALGGRQVIRGELALGELAAVVLYLMALGHRMGAIGQFTSIVQNASASAERILEILDEPHLLKGSGREPADVDGSIRFENVTFGYPGSAPALDNVSFAVPSGMTVALVGPTGAGKSTLAQLIPRFRDPGDGRVILGGVDARDWPLQALRRQIGVVFQETFLFSARVWENIALGRPEASREEIEAAARAAQADEFIRGLEHGYETMIGERGVNLSGGQKQRIALARALLMNPRILILDDATASVDPATEHAIQTALAAWRKDRTCLMIAHRLSALKAARHILVLDRGKLVDQGGHEDLVERCAFYRDLVKHQSRVDAESSPSSHG
ncbi:MAG: ABC transporter ATP-binding protein [Verrucomicrobia bacterium]|nr:ABC transporter ATP-binding protein [Verrucomicrobiota bacterium]